MSALPENARRWIEWRLKGDRKEPVHPRTGTPFNTFQTKGCVERSELPRDARPGFILGPINDNEAIIGLDLDVCLNAGKLVPWAQDVLDAIVSYGEISPSKTGLKIFARVSLETFEAVQKLIGGQKKKDLGSIGRSKHPPGILLMLGGYFTVTDDAWDKTPLRTITLDGVKRVIKIGERIKAGDYGGGTTGDDRDESRNTVLHRLARDCVDRMERAEFGKAILDTDSETLECSQGDADAAAGHVNDQHDGDRAINRSWAKARIMKLARESRATDKTYAQFIRSVGRIPEIGSLGEEEKAQCCKREWEEASESKFDDLGSEADTLFPIYAWPNPSDIPPRQFLYRKDYVRGFVSATVALGGAGKTALLVSEALSMAAGVDLLSCKPDGDRKPTTLAHGPLRTAIWNLEDDKVEMDRRLAGARLHYARLLKGTGFETRLTVKSAEQPICVAAMDRGQVAINKKLVRKLIEAIKTEGIDVLIVDPYVSTHDTEENDNRAVDSVVKRVWAYIAHETRCAIMLVHHVRKPAHGQVTIDVLDSRGAVALINAVRVGRVLNRLSAEDAPRFDVGVESAWSHVRVDNAKANLAPPGTAVWRRLRSVRLCNGEDLLGDEIGVAEHWSPPDHSNIPNHERASIVKAMEGRSWRKSVSANDWVGVAVAKALGLKLDNPAERAKVRIKVNAAIEHKWMEESEEEIGGKKRPMVRAVEQKTEIRDLIG